MVRKGTSSNKTCMQWLREIFWICKIYQIRLVPYYINTKNNLVADTLSRLFYINPDYTGVLHVGRFAWGFLSYVISLIFKKSESFFQNASYDELTTEM